ncbi:ATPase P [Lysobacter dokdonensis DS-58]|uniref:ATPase P n=1 Tax=Lysobacter dokdonensis DS-58 TaxID=1300345 RepID=A0A0A2WJQ4_9GAMM|nr:heavy metal translocating P-type ATPase [Lysobacter dokdonensis]KGQ20033.1 ATPase P [Lysobacter dokdonensis DS-58]
MNAIAATAQAGADADAACFHCNEPTSALSPRVAIDGVERAFCCEGCAAAAQWIRDARLGDYYRLRSEAAGRVDADAGDLTCWDREDILAGHARAVPGGRELILLTDGMRCAACAWLIDRALRREPGVLDVSANAVTGRIRIAWDPARTALSAPLRRLASLGYRPWLATGTERERARIAERNRALLRLGVAGLGAVQAMMFTEALYLDTTGAMSHPMRDFLRWIAFLVATPVVFWSGWTFLSGCLRELRERRLGADTLVATSVLLAYFASLYATLTGAPHVWYDAAVMFVFLLLAARMLEQRARAAATARVDALARARPAFAVRERDGHRETIPLDALQPGDIACVAAGAGVPADGDLLDAQAWFEESLLTGESTPVHKRAGDPVFAGTACRDVPARVRVASVGTATRLSQLAALVERAQAHRPAIARMADRVAMGFVAVLLVVATLVYFAWRAHAPDRALDVVLALLVVSCPCALSLAIPTALAAANGALARMGVLPAGADALDRLARATDVVFDKTGTLGDAVPTLAQAAVFGDMTRDRALQIAAALERDSHHPLASTFAPYRDVACRIETTRTLPGQGVQGIVDGIGWRLGHAPFATGGIDDGALWLGDGAKASARFDVRERPRADAASTLDALRAQGLALHLCSGDGHAAVARFAETLRFDDTRARQAPEDKLAFVRALQSQGRRVAMVGDGLNDAPVLAGADVSIAVADGAALAQRAADLVLATRSLQRIPEAFALARDTRRIIRQNLAWAVGWNLVALPVAAFGLVTPWIAALGMALSSLTVTLNALRLGRDRKALRA